MDNITLLSCSYNTPDITISMLKSFFSLHEKTKVLICENSTNDDTVKLLDEHSVPYIRNVGGLHSPSVDILIENCKTDYALLVDTDVIFLKNHEKVFDMFKKCGASLLGTVCGDRGGKKLHYRVHPWHCFINIKHIKENGIKFFDGVRQSDKTGRIYDVGATFFEDIRKSGLKIGDVNLQDDYYIHYEGMSWRTLKYGDKDGDIDLNPLDTHNNLNLYKHGLLIESLYKERTPKYDGVLIKSI